MWPVIERAGRYAHAFYIDLRLLLTLTIEPGGWYALQNTPAFQDVIVCVKSGGTWSRS